jgi:hypothetical protein
MDLVTLLYALVLRKNEDTAPMSWNNNRERRNDSNTHRNSFTGMNGRQINPNG